jgi:hypothetical protein
VLVPKAKLAARGHCYRAWVNAGGYELADRMTAEWDREPDLYEAMCIRDYGILQLARGAVKIR